MSLETPSNIIPDSTQQHRGARLLAGLALLAPACLCCFATLALPTVQTMLFSLQRFRLSRAIQFVGLANYSQILQDKAFANALGFTLQLALERVLVVAFVPLLLALAVNEFGRKVRVPVRLLFSLPLVLFAPVAVTLSWKLALLPKVGLVEQNSRLLIDPQQARWTLLGVDALVTMGLACGIGLIVYLAALRGAGESAPTGKQVVAPLFVTWAVTVLATLALSLSSFNPSYLLTRGGPQNSTMTLMLYQYQISFTTLDFGRGATIAVLLLIVLMLLGLVASAPVVVSGLRLDTVPPAKPAGLLGPSRKRLAAVLLAVLLLASLVTASGGWLPSLWTTGLALQNSAAFSKVPSSIQIGPAWLNTVLPTAAVIVLVQLPLTLIAALGIGALRPFGRHSEWLLLLFAPWLLVDIGPLSMVFWQSVRDAKLVNAVGFAPPLLLSIPMLFILTLFFKGQLPKWRAARAAGQSAWGAGARTLLLPVLPLAVLLTCVSLAISQQELLWSMLNATTRSQTLPVALARLGALTAVNAPLLSAALLLLTSPSVVWNVLVLGVFQIFYLDRLALGRAASDDQSL